MIVTEYMANGSLDTFLRVSFTTCQSSDITFFCLVLPSNRLLIQFCDIIYTWLKLVQWKWNWPKANLLGTYFCVWNRQVFRLYRLNPRFRIFGLYLELSLYKSPAYSGFDLDSFRCICSVLQTKSILQNSVFG